MNKLYWIVCDDKETNVFEGRYQGRTIQINRPLPS